AWQCLAARKGKDISVMALWEKRLEAFGNWYAQLSAESLGKDGVGRTPLTIVCTRELHSLGQLHQEGPRNRVITNVRVTGGGSELAVPELPAASTAHLASGRRISELNDMAYQATDTAYATAQRPGMTVEIGAVDEEHLGALVFLFETATILEGKLLGVNPINQPGVKRYKDFLGALLGEPSAKQYRAEYDAWHRRLRDYRV
ncbi:MAG: glucose-6-phosphate isomerase, partial [Armatimonadetes bacterium]|nr:glucose-6-phosphate isomerase [Armatimonadota bacterium]